MRESLWLDNPDFLLVARAAEVLKLLLRAAKDLDVTRGSAADPLAALNAPRAPQPSARPSSAGAKAPEGASGAALPAIGNACPALGTECKCEVYK